MTAALMSPRLMRSILPAMSLTVILIAIFYLQPRAMSYFGLNLLLNLAVPIALATIAQMFILCVNDLDLSIGAYVSFCACVAATWLSEVPLLGVAVLVACIGVYAALGALIHLRNLPSIVVTLGMSFVWAGLAVLLLPTPGGKALKRYRHAGRAAKAGDRDSIVRRGTQGRCAVHGRSSVTASHPPAGCAIGELEAVLLDQAQDPLHRRHSDASEVDTKIQDVPFVTVVVA